jgi:hypothetical protein
MESAASILGLAQRTPSREVVALPQGVPLPKAMSQWRSTTVAIPLAGRTMVRGLPIWTVNGLVAGIAMRPSGYQDVVGLAQWLPESARGLDTDIIAQCLGSAPQAAWQRAAYLARLAGNVGVSGALLAARPPRQMVWFGATRRGGRFDRATQVTDADLAPYLYAGTGR